MQTKFTFKHLEPLDCIKDYALSKMDRLEKFSLHKEERIHFIFSAKKEIQTAEILVDIGPVHHSAIATEDTLYAAIDSAMDKMERQLQKHKEKLQDHHRKDEVEPSEEPTD